MFCCCFLVGRKSSHNSFFFGVFFWVVFGVFVFLVFLWNNTLQQKDGKVLGQHLTAMIWEGFGTAPDSKQMGREIGYGGVGVPCIYVPRTVGPFSIRTPGKLTANLWKLPNGTWKMCRDVEVQVLTNGW